jgi:hypothetical protein
MSLDRLPLDLILDIADHLPASSVACLSLTCKSLYYSQPLRSIWTQALDTPTSRWLRTGCSLRFAPYDCHRDHQYFEFVKMLRRDIPTHLLCSCCNKFHPKLVPKVLRPGMGWAPCPTAPLRGSYISWPNFGVRLQFEDVQMVMDRHRWGGRHGAPLSSIAISTDWNVIGNTRCGPVVCKFDLEPEIVDQSLVLHTTQRIFTTDRRIVSRFETLFDDPDSLNPFRACKHHVILADGISSHISRWLESYHNRKFDHARRWHETALTWCKYCSTCSFSEVVFLVDGGPGTTQREGQDLVPAEGLEITLHSWMLLGSCEDTFSPAWFNMSKQRGPIEPRYPVFLVLGANRITVDMFRIVLPRVGKQYSKKFPCFETLNHPSLLSAIDRAVALENDPFEVKHHEFTKILRAAGHKIDRLDLKSLVDKALEGRWMWYKEHLRSDQPESVRTAMRIIQEHKRNNAKAKLKKLGSRVLAKLSLGLFKTSQIESKKLK